MNNDTLDLIILGIMLSAVLFIFIKISLHVRKHGGV
jgi:hypothetical protein